jgi:aryl-alcohol dehydrogenase (NADP+)
VRFRTEQPPYSIFNRSVEAVVLPTAQRYGMGVLTWSPLASGWLSGRYDKASDVDLSEGRKSVQRHKFDVIAELKKLAAEIGESLPHLADLLAGVDLVLSDDVLDRIDEIVPPGTDLNKFDADHAPRALLDKTLRRR